jgi:hypothetical protein
MVLSVLVHSLTSLAEVFALDCQFGSHACRDGVAAVGFGVTHQMQESMKDARRMCERLLLHHERWLEVIVRAVSGVGVPGWVRRVGWAISGSGAAGVLLCTAGMAAVAVLWVGEPFNLPLTGLVPRVVSLLACGAGAAVSIAWPTLAMSVLGRRRAERATLIPRETCVQFLVSPQHERIKFDGKSAGMAWMSTLAARVPDLDRTMPEQWRVALRDPNRRWAVCVEILDPERGILKGVREIDKKLAALVVWSAHHPARHLTDAVFHVDDKDEVTRQWAALGKHRLNPVSHPGGYLLADSDGVRFLFCSDRDSFLHGVIGSVPRNAAAWFRLFRLPALFVLCLVFAVLIGPRPPKPTAGCGSAFIVATGQGTTVQVARGGSATCRVDLGSTGYFGPVVLTPLVGLPGERPSGVVRIHTERELRELRSGEPMRTTESAVNVQFSAFADSRRMATVDFTVCNRGERCDTLSLRFVPVAGGIP